MALPFTLTGDQVGDAMVGVFQQRLACQEEQLKLRRQGRPDNPALDAKVLRLQILERGLEKAMNGEPA